ncbi:MAG: lipid-binding SYLF domain-containing protein [Planctomycetota bacterium]|jgi:lipid-binding SYLF domain-containing protein
MNSAIKPLAFTVITTAVLLAGCGSQETPEGAAATQTSEGEKTDAKQEAQQEALAKDQAELEEKLGALHTSAIATIDRAKKEVAGIEEFFGNAVGYVVFPKVAKGGLVVGGAHGNGVVFERRSIGRDTIIGSAEVAQGSIGLQIGGQTFSEIVFFEDETTFENFKKSNLEFSGRASGVAGGEGATVAAKYENGTAAFVFGEKGLMGEAAIGGQKFTFKAIE